MNEKRLMGSLQALIDGNREKYLEIAPLPYPNMCPNCGGAGIVMVYELETTEPMMSPPGTKGSKWLELPGKKPGWYKGKLISELCPVCRKDQKREFLEANCGLSGDELSVMISTFYNLAGKEQARSVAAKCLAEDNPSGFWTFYGDYGTGKTHLLMAIVNGWRLKGIYSRYTTLPELLSDISSRFGDRSPAGAAEAVLDSYKRIPVLAIDEFDKKNQTGWSMEVVERLIEERYRENYRLLTIFAMNSDPDKLSDGFGYLVSRLRSGEIVKVGGEDMRAGHPDGRGKEFAYKDA